MVALLVTPQLLLFPLLQSPANTGMSSNIRGECGQVGYFRAVQFQLMMCMFLTALALGYTL
jgi:hypothetical protein